MAYALSEFRYAGNARKHLVLVSDLDPKRGVALLIGIKQQNIATSLRPHDGEVHGYGGFSGPPLFTAYQYDAHPNPSILYDSIWHHTI